MVTTLEVEVVDMATTQDISLTAILGEYFSSSHFVVLYHSYFVLVSYYEITKTQKDSNFSSFLFTSGHLLYASKNQKEQKDFRFLESDAKMEVQELLKSAHCFIFYFLPVTPVELKF